MYILKHKWFNTLTITCNLFKAISDVIIIKRYMDQIEIVQKISLLSIVQFLRPIIYIIVQVCDFGLLCSVCVD